MSEAPNPIQVISSDKPDGQPFLFFLNGELFGQKVVLRFPFSIGRSSDSDLCLTDSATSRNHARLEVIDGKICITDLGSKNGVILNGKKINRTTFLKSYDLIRIGQSLFLFNKEIPINNEQYGSKKILEISYQEETFYDEIIDPREIDPTHIDRQTLKELFDLLLVFQSEFSNPASLLEIALKKLLVLFKADMACIYLLNILKNQYEPGIILSKELTPALPINIIKRCAKDKKAFLSHDLWNETAEGQFLKNVGNKARSLMVSPLLEGDSCSGILAISSILPKFFSSNTLEICSLIARYIATNLSNESLWDVLLKRYKGEKKAKEIIFIGESQIAKDIIKMADIIAKEKVNVLLTGESGVGKEVLARFIHARSAKSSGPFVPINCASIPETLLESELFGAEKGAYTGANELRIGKFELADGGTLFLDEIGEMPLTIQPKLLRIIETSKFYRLGGKEEINADVRIICATNKDLYFEVQKKFFREDLFYRINVAHINIPPLRERTEDIMVFVEHYLNIITEELGKTEPFKLSTNSIPLLLSYPWYGNVRELKNILERVALLSESATLSDELFKKELSSTKEYSSLMGSANKIESAKLADVVQAVEKSLILNTLIENNFKKNQTAHKLGISRPTLDKKIKEYNIQIKPEDDKED